MVAGIAGVWMAYRLGSALGGAPAARAMGILAALSPAWVAYSHEARPYAIGLLLLLVLYVQIAEDRECPRAHLVTAVLCGLWQYTVAVMAVASLVVVAVRRPDRWGLPLIACGATAALTAGFMLPVQWERTHDFSTRMDPAIGVEALAWGPPGLAGFTVLGMSGVVSMVVGGALLVGVVALRRSAAYDLALIWAPLGVFACLAVLGLHPFGAVRPCLPLTLPMLILGVGALVNAPRPFQMGVPLCLLLVVGWRSPGVPVEDVPGLVGHLPTNPGHVYAHASSVHALELYAPDLKLDDVIPWGCSPTDFPTESGWLIVSGRPRCLELISERRKLLDPHLTLEGVRLFRTPLFVPPATPQPLQEKPRQSPEGP